MQRLPSASRDAKNLICFETKSFDLENASTKKRETLFFIFIMKISSFEKVCRDGIIYIIPSLIGCDHPMTINH